MQNQYVDSHVERYDFVIRDRLTNSVVGEATLPIGTGWEHRDILCGKKPFFEKLASALFPIPDPRYLRPEEVMVQSSEFVDQGTATDQLLGMYRWNGSVKRDNLSNIVSQDGNAWVEPFYERGMLRRYSLALIVGDKLFKTPIVPEGWIASWWLTGIGLSADSVATIAMESAQARTAKLLVFSRQGEPQSAYSINAVQLDRLKGQP